MIKAKVIKIDIRVTIVSNDGVKINVMRRLIPFGILEGDVIFYCVENGDYKFKPAYKKDVSKGETYYTDENKRDRSGEHASFLGVSLEEYLQSTNSPKEKMDITAFVWSGLGLVAIISLFYIAFIVFSGGSSEKKELKRNQSNNTVACQKMMKGYLNYPNTFNQNFGGIQYENYGGLNYRINLSFSAKNAFGMESEFTGFCDVVSGVVDSAVLN